MTRPATVAGAIVGQPRPGGFTLIELVVAMAVLAILVSIAYPLYLDQMRKTRRTEAVSNLLIMANLQERFFQSSFVYTTVPSAIGFAAPAGAQYDYSIPTANAATFTVQAAAKSGTQQYQDTQCRTLTLNAAGARSAKDTSDNTTTALCWRQ